MFSAIINAFKIEDLRKKILFTLFIVLLYRVGCHIPAPGVDVNLVAETVKNNAALGFLNLFTGSALQQLSVFALGVMPYITSSIIMQLLQAAIPTIEEWSKDEAGQRKITQITRYITIGIGLVESIGLLYTFRSAIRSVASIPGWLTPVMIVGSLLAGTALIMWISELITQRGVGNGMSMIIFSSIVARFPAALIESLKDTVTGAWKVWWQLLITAAVIIIVLLVVIFVVIYIEEGQRRIPVQYAKRVVGRRVFGGSGTYIPLKVNGANVVPMIFASAILTIPLQLSQIFPQANWLSKIANFVSPQSSSATAALLPWYSGWGNWLITFILIVFFAYFYTALVFNPIDISDNLRKQGGFIPGIRPGNNTTRYIEQVMNRITLPGALFLGCIAVGTSVVFALTKSPMVNQFGGTSILIMVGVALETMQQIESQLTMRHYEGFFK
ncbi:MAG: preprotein translocase subunit SecY [Actinomycetes bacterium]|jgi:preprotein translocase subunit SecY|nr:preprotein translocase subunit SecY [Actinomycetes bacterium]